VPTLLAARLHHYFFDADLRRFKTDCRRFLPNNTDPASQKNCVNLRDMHQKISSKLGFAAHHRLTIDNEIFRNRLVGTERRPNSLRSQPVQHTAIGNQILPNRGPVTSRFDASAQGVIGDCAAAKAEQSAK
jgi:hypothetical protein